MVATANLDKVEVITPGTTDETFFMRFDYTRIADKSKDFFVGEYDYATVASDLLSQMESDSGEEFV